MNETVDSPYILSASGDEFRSLVLENSNQGPVLVNFWSVKVETCIEQYPLLERVIRHYDGRVLLVNVDADSETAVAAQYDVIGLPTLKLFYRGEAVATQLGYGEEGELRKLLGLYVARESDLILADAVDQYARGEQQAAYVSIADAVANDPDNPRLPLTLCKLLRHEGRYTEALKVLDSLPKTLASYPEIGKLHDQLAFHVLRDSKQDSVALEAVVDADPSAITARQQLVAQYVIEERYEAALQQLAAIAEQSPEFEQGFAVQAMQRVFNMLGEEHPLVAQFRPSLPE
ncbi:MAG: tetratricopeptide repeat protein [Thiohalophilus sp.]|jgi:putative thioredoxin